MPGTLASRRAPAAKPRQPGVRPDLEGGAQVLRADHGPQLLAVDLLLHLREQLAELGDLRIRLALPQGTDLTSLSWHLL